MAGHIDRRTALAALLGAVAGCGGGSTLAPAVASCTPPRLLSCWGDSTHSGGYAVMPGSAETRYLAPRPTARIVQQLGGGVLGIDRSVAGSLAHTYLSGWPSTVEMDPAQVQVLRFGGADALVGTPLPEFRAAMREMVSTSLRLGRRVVLVGVIHVATSKPEWGWTDSMLLVLDGRAAAANDVLAEVAALHGVPFADIRRAVRFDGSADIADLVHPGQAYSNRCADLIAATAAPLFVGVT